MINMTKLKSNSKGFTIIELMIATSVFSILLLVCLASIAYIGRLYYKGVTSAKTNEVSRSTIDSVSQAIQFSGRDVIERPLSLGTGWTAYCIGSQKYSFKLDTQLRYDAAATAQNVSNEVLILSTDTICSDPNPTNVNKKELLSENMRLLDFRISEAGANYANLYNVNVAIAYGGRADIAGDDDDVFSIDNSGNIIGCLSGAKGSEFCTVTRLQTTVFRKVQ